MKYAVQLYSLREIAKRDGAEKIFKMAAEAGYDGVEFAGFYGKTPKEIHALLNKYNLIGISAHILPQDVEKNISYIEKLGIKFVFNPWVDLEVFETPTKYAELVDITNKAKMMLDSHGVVLGYHNHSQEFNNGNNYVKKLTDDILGLKAELDVFWAYVANRDPMEEMKALKEKLVFVHIKEAAKENARESV